mmetsp:Transcript_19001/g.45825  ORF Transcript_19001/g.45825 Transcript_19001/m.45825 type:complete len:236 (-) Transcript_19001:81-788(-)
MDKPTLCPTTTLAHRICPAQILAEALPIVGGLGLFLCDRSWLRGLFDLLKLCELLEISRSCTSNLNGKRFFALLALRHLVHLADSGSSLLVHLSAPISRPQLQHIQQQQLGPLAVLGAAPQICQPSNAICHESPARVSRVHRKSDSGDQLAHALQEVLLRVLASPVLAKQQLPCHSLDNLHRQKLTQIQVPNQLHVGQNLLFDAQSLHRQSLGIVQKHLLLILRWVQCLGQALIL